jgi:hypothetical protein
LILAGACLSDRPVAPRGSDGSLALRVNASRTVAPAQVKQSVDVLIYYVVPDDIANADVSTQLFHQTYPTNSGFTRVTANFPLSSCLALFPQDALGAYCDVNVQVSLLEDSAVVDQQIQHGLRVRPGVVTNADSVTLGVANAPPVLTGTPARGLLVDPPTHLVWYGVTGTDQNADISGAVAVVVDSSSGSPSTTTQFFAQPLGAVGIAAGPSLYAVGPPAAMSYRTQLVDAQANVSNADSAGIDQPDPASAPYVFYAQNTVTTDSIAVLAQWSSGGAPMRAVEFVVRTYSGIGVDTVYMVCTIAVPDQKGTVSGTCPRVGRAFTSALITAVPLDSAGTMGYGITCDLGESCGGGVVVPRRVRRH